MKKYKRIFVAGAALLMAAPAHAYTDRDTAVVRVMNKAAGKAYTVKLPVGRETRFEKLEMLARTCKQTDPFMAEDFFTFIEISQQDDKFFSGWMSRNEPGANPLQHPDYDVWLVGCE